MVIFSNKNNLSAFITIEKVNFFHQKESSSKDEIINLNSLLKEFERLTYILERGVGISILDVNNLTYIDGKKDDWNGLTLRRDTSHITGSRGYINNLFSMLILAFPEVHWVFAVPKGKNWDLGGLRHPGIQNKEERPISDRFHFIELDTCSNITTEAIEEILRNSLGYEPLFDPLGIRNQIRKNLKTGESKNKFLTLPLRNSVAAAIDEEIPYAYLNAYTAYKFGYRAWAIYTDTIARAVFGSNNNNQQEIDLVFEDLYLNFPDRPSNAHYSNLSKRDDTFPLLKKVKYRFFVTVGHAINTKEKKTLKSNKKYLEDLKELEKYDSIYKTTGGIHALWERAGFYRNRKPRLAPGFKWPPNKRTLSKSQEESENSNGGHSAPGTLLTISQFMIERAKRILKDATTVREALTSAVLAMEAKELLMGKTPITSYEALKVQHEAEIMAESMFLGVEYNLRVKDRFKEIEREAKSFSIWFKKSYRKRSELNARLTIAERLAKRFSDLNQFEEEQASLQEARKIRFKFWARQKNSRLLLYPLLKYIEVALSSISKFIIIVVMWAFIFGFSYYGLAKISHRKCNCSFWEAMAASTVYYFTLQSPQHWSDLLTCNCPYNKKNNTTSTSKEEKSDKVPFENHMWNVLWYFLLTFQGTISLLNLGLLISHIYLIISRR